jgi:Protein of unknown function (DUF642)
MIWVLVAAAVALAAPAGAASKLVRNGGFEKPSVGGTFIVFTTGQSFPGWTVVGAPGNVGIVAGTFTQNGYTFPAKAGAQWIDLTGLSNTATGVAQTVKNLVSGSPYTLTFFVGNVSNPGGIFGTTSTVNVLVNGAPLMTAVNSNGAGTTTQVWKKFTKTFLAPAATTTISFVNGDPANDTNNGLDGVSLSAAP